MFLGFVLGGIWLILGGNLIFFGLILGGIWLILGGKPDVFSL